MILLIVISVLKTIVKNITTSNMLTAKKDMRCWSIMELTPS